MASRAAPERRRRLAPALLVLVLLGAAAGAAALLYLGDKGIAPRTLGPYLALRSSGHNRLIESAGQLAAGILVTLDRGSVAVAEGPALTIGFQPATAGAASHPLLVSTSAEARQAIAAASAGDTITLLPGTYRFDGHVDVGAAGRADAPITLRALRAGSVTLEMNAGEGFKVSAPYWRFENLAIRGVCAEDQNCEHAFHVVAGAHHFVARNNTISDFNAHFKINGENGLFPDHGLVEANTLSNGHPRRTGKPVTPIDLVAASDWTVRRNVISDFVKTGGDQVSYGGFFKGAGARNLFEQNVVLCEQRLRGLPGQRVGFALGGGATDRPYCRDRRCVVEQEHSTVRANLIAACSDAGLYLNSAADSKIVHNTLVDTGGIQLRYPETSAQIDGNLIDGSVSGRDGALVRLGDNQLSPLAYAYLGWHRVRGLFVAPAAGDFRWRGEAPRRDAGGAAVPDLCGAPRQGRPAYGAFDDFAACLSAPAASR